VRRLLRRRAPRIPFLLCLLPALLLAAVPAAARPALWAVHSGQATVYLFGTVHLLPGDAQWRFPALQRALDQSGELYLELTDDDPATMGPLVARYGLDHAHPLPSLLHGAERERLALAARTAGVPEPALDAMRPWLAALTLSVAPLLKAGLDPAQGVDHRLRAEMEQAGKPVHGLETAAEQIGFLAGMPPRVQLDMLRETFDEIDDGPARLRALIAAWKAGDTAAIARVEDEDLRRQSPALYRTLLADRNRRWAQRIAERLRQPGTSFVAVGAGHLAGPDSVQRQLARLGIEARPVP
jgi:hypothetical protein